MDEPSIDSMNEQDRQISEIVAEERSRAAQFHPPAATGFATDCVTAGCWRTRTLSDEPDADQTGPLLLGPRAARPLSLNATL